MKGLKVKLKLQSKHNSKQQSRAGLLTHRPKVCNAFLVLFFFSTLLLTACGKPKAMILFNNNPITKENLLANSTEFSTGKRIYYIFITEEPLKTTFVRIRILKRDEKVNFETTKIVYSNDFRLNKDQIYYYTDYIVMNEAGRYCMYVYTKNELDHPLAIADFRVK